MDVVLQTGKLIDHLPPAIGLVVSLSLLLFGVWLRAKKQMVETKKVDADIYNANVKTLVDQIKILSEELLQTRQQLAALHVQNVDLMNQLRASNRKIAALEDTLGRNGLMVGSFD